MPLTFHLIPHTHWDREWYLTRAGFQARLVPLLDDALNQLERDPSARFLLDGQTVLLEDYLAIKPENEARIAALVRRGALEIGPWYVLSDLLIPSADSLRRNLEQGKLDAERFGRRLDVLYSPDAFGHPGSLPSIAAQFGIHRAVIRRGLGRPLGRDSDLYHWEAEDESRLLVHHLPAAGYDAAIDLIHARTDAELARTWEPIRNGLVARALTDQIAVFLGADHHAMAPDVRRLRGRLQALESRHEVRVSGLTEFFDAVELARPDPPVIRGELRRSDGHTWVLQGVHASRTRLKRKFSRAELLLSKVAEPLAGVASSGGGRDRRALLRVAWRTLLQSQFHDTLAGSTSDAVQREQEVRLAAVEAIGREIATRTLWELVEYDPDRAREEPDRESARLLLWNPSDRTRSEITTAERAFFRTDLPVGPPSSRKPRQDRGYQPFALVGPSRAVIPVQILGVRRGVVRKDADRHYPDQDEVDRVWVAFRVAKIRGRGVVSLAPKRVRRSLQGETVEAREVGRMGLLANRAVVVRISRTGTLMIEDRRTGAEYCRLCELMDESDAGDLYTFSAGCGTSPHGGRPVAQRAIARGPLVGAMETRWTMPSAGHGRIGVRQVVALYADSPLVRLRLDIENAAPDHRLRARFPVGAGEAALAGAALGVER